MSSILNGASSANFMTAVQTMISRSCIVDFGVIQKADKKGIVEVAVSVADSSEDIKYITCVLANTASSSVTVNIKPNVGDKVIVLYPRRFDSKMFSTDNKDVIVNKNARGYNLFSGIALLCNQYKVNSHKNLITLEDGTVTIQLVYNEDDDKNKVIASINSDGELAYSSNENFNLNVNKDGEFAYSSNENFNLNVNKDGEFAYSSNENFNLNVNKDGELAYSSNDNFNLNVSKDGSFELASNNVQITTNSNDEVSITNGKATVKIDSSGNVTVETSGKYKFKNNTTDLKSVIDGLAKEVENLTTVGSPATQSTSPATKALITTWRQSKLNLLLD